MVVASHFNEPSPGSTSLEHQRQADANALRIAALMLMEEGLEKGFHYFALHLRVAILELESQMGTALPSPPLTPLSDLPKPARRKPEISSRLRTLIRGAPQE